ncbi:hypothetical protein IWQ60_011891, partial [Tieghemiomyces parasiticus]
MPYAIKLMFRGVARKFVFNSSDELQWDAMDHNIRCLFHIDFPFQLEYEDEDGEIITCSSSYELREIIPMLDSKGEHALSMTIIPLNLRSRATYHQIHHHANQYSDGPSSFSTFDSSLESFIQHNHAARDPAPILPSRPHTAQLARWPTAGDRVVPSGVDRLVAPPHPISSISAPNLPTHWNRPPSNASSFFMSITHDEDFTAPVTPRVGQAELPMPEPFTSRRQLPNSQSEHLDPAMQDIEASIDQLTKSAAAITQVINDAPSPVLGSAITQVIYDVPSPFQTSATPLPPPAAANPSLEPTVPPATNPAGGHTMIMSPVANPSLARAQNPVDSGGGIPVAEAEDLLFQSQISELILSPQSPIAIASETSSIHQSRAALAQPSFPPPPAVAKAEDLLPNAAAV